MKLTVSLAQIAVAQSQPEANLEKGERLIAEAARRGSGLVCFPEMWTTGFNWARNEQMAKAHEAVIDKVAEMARRYAIWVNGSMLALDEGGRVSNTSILFSPEGQKAWIYRKTHLFSLFHEERHMAAGRCLTVALPPWGPTGLSVCYDIRFPELFRTYALKGARLVLSPMAFPHPRLDHWKILVRARAIENQLFMIGVNQVGSEDFGPDDTVTYFGNSVVIDPWGRTVVEASETDEMLLTATLDLDQADEVRSRMRVLQDRRPELYELE
jgi:predicted amidohydrolase